MDTKKLSLQRDRKSFNHQKHTKAKNTSKQKATRNWKHQEKGFRCLIRSERVELN